MPDAFPGWAALLPLCAVAGSASGVLNTAPNPDSRGWVLVVSGGGEDDQAFARAAFGWQGTSSRDPEALRRSVEAVRATDRFRRVELREVPGSSGSGVLSLLLDPWPKLEGWTWTGSADPALTKDLLWEMKVGRAAGNLRLRRWKELVELRLKAQGYPAARVEIRRQDRDTRLELELHPGPRALVRRFEVEGDAGSYGVEGLRKRAKIEVGASVWTDAFARQALARLRTRFQKDHRYEWRAELSWSAAEGTVRLKVDPGPIVDLRREGDGLPWWTRTGDLVPLARADRYVPELLDEGSRKILRRLSEDGYLQAKVDYRREVLEGPPAHPTRVAVTYHIQAGPRFLLTGTRFERNRDFPGEEITGALEMPTRWFGLKPSYAKPEALEVVDAQVRNFYALKGYPDFDTKRKLEGAPEQSRLVFSVREGAPRKLKGVVLVVPRGSAWNGELLAESLGFLLSESPQFQAEGPGKRGLLAARPHLQGLKASLVEDPFKEGAEGRTFRLIPESPVPLVKAHLAELLTVLRQRLTTLGVQRPVERLSLVPGEDGLEARIEVPIQPIGTIKRLIVQGVDRTRARAIFRQMQLDPGMPMDPGRLVRAQAQLSNLEVFQRLGLEDLAQAEDAPEGRWEEGDLRLQLEERSHWVFSSGFGYDKVQGYYFLLGAQRLNLGGMGRSLDFSIRAGDGTIDSEKLREWFPTGQNVRSVDSYTVGYTDPWFAPGFLEELMKSPTQFRMEGAYIEERRSVYLLHRRRILDTFEWKPWSNYRLQVGYRWERVDTKAANSQVSDDELATLAGYPPQSIISAPFVQVVRDTRDNPLDPTSGKFAVVRLEIASQALGTSDNSSFIKVDARQQWNWALGRKARWGVVSLGLRVGIARPTAPSSEDFPLSERFFAGGPGTHRGVEPDGLGPQGQVPLRDPARGWDYVRDPQGNIQYQDVALGGQALVLGNLDYRFPIIGRSVWGEFFVDSGQVYAKLKGTEADPAKFPPLRTALGAGLIFKVGVPIKIEYGADVRRLLGKPRSEQDRKTELKSLLVSAGFQF